MDPRTPLTTMASTLLLAALHGPAHASDDLSWLAGAWCGGDAGERMEEHWLEPAGGQLLGVSRTLKGERLASFEFLRIAPVDGVPTYLAQPGGRPPTPFARSAGGDNWVRFENPAHDFPTRIEYRRSGERLHAEIAGPGDGGKEQVIAFGFTRCEG